MAVSLTINRDEDITELYEAIREICERLEFPEELANRANLVARELMTNVQKHSDQPAYAIAGSEEVNERKSVFVATMDSGPGLPENPSDARTVDPDEGLGLGLGVIERNADMFSQHSTGDSGTIFAARIDENKSSDSGESPTNLFDISGINIPLEGEQVSGDGWEVRETDNSLLVLLVDGVGHGEKAGAAAKEAKNSFSEHFRESPETILSNIHEDLKKTRGGVVSITKILPNKQEICFAGIGDTKGRIYNGNNEKTSLVSLQGTCGIRSRTIREFTYPFPEGSSMVLFTDGIQSRWKQEDYPGLFQKPALIISSLLAIDQQRERDDSCVVTVRFQQDNMSP